MPPENGSIYNVGGVDTVHQASLSSSAVERLRRKARKKVGVEFAKGELLEGGRKPAQLVVYPLFYP